MNAFFTVLAPLAMASAGAALKAKDTNDTGADDTIGNLLILESPIVDMALNGQSDLKKTKKIMTAIRDGAQTWLDANP